MAKDHFAIERPRKISISIQGYDARSRVTEQRKKQEERTKRLQRKQKRAPVQTAEEGPVSLAQSDDAAGVEALAAAAATLPKQLEVELREAFAGSPVGGRA